jgi:predicted RNA binding protein YcfA (HicA-like mRNA interferase family)
MLSIASTDEPSTRSSTMNKRKLLQKLLSGSKNVRFADLIALVEAFGFERVRTSGSHQIFQHPSISELLSLQSRKGQAKPDQAVPRIGRTV